jgi:hypothetical protein
MPVWQGREVSWGQGYERGRTAKALVAEQPVEERAAHDGQLARRPTVSYRSAATPRRHRAAPAVAVPLSRAHQGWPAS